MTDTFRHRPPLPAGWLLLGLLPVMTQAAEFRLDNRTELMHFTVTGAGKSQSYLDPGSHMLHESDLYWAERDGRGWDQTLEASLRLTDSEQFDPEFASLQKLEWRLTDRTQTLTVGDYFANFSSYSLSRGIKGLGYQRNLGNDQNYLRATVGSFDGQWSSIYRQGYRYEPMDRTGAALRWQKASGAWRTGLNLVTVDDRADDPHRVGQDAFRQTLPAFDWEWREGATVVSGEHAFARTDVDSLTTGSRDDNGSANKLSLRHGGVVFDVDAQAERVGTQFVSLGGGATPDRLRGYVRTDARVARWWKAFLSADHSRNNLDDQLAATTNLDTWELGATQRRFLGRKPASLAVSVRRRQLDTSGGGQENRSDRIRLKYRDRLGVPGVDVGAELEQVVDKSNGAGAPSRNDTLLYNLTAAMRHRLGERWDADCSAEYGVQEMENVTQSTWDVLRRGHLGVSLAGPDGLQVGLNLDRDRNALAAANADAHTGRALLYVQARPARLKGGVLRLELGDNRYDFEDDTRDYRERLAKLALRWSL